MSQIDTVAKGKCSAHARMKFLVATQGTVKIHRSNGCSMSRCPCTTADRWVCPTGSGRCHAARGGHQVWTVVVMDLEGKMELTEPKWTGVLFNPTI